MGRKRKSQILSNKTWEFAKEKQTAKPRLYKFVNWAFNNKSQNF